MTEEGQLPELNKPVLNIVKGVVLCVSVKKPHLYPKGRRGQVVQVLHCKSGGATDGEQKIILMMRMEKNLTPIKLKNWESWTVSGCLEARVGGKYIHLGTPTPIRDRVCWKGKVTVVHWGFLPVGGKCKPWVITPYVMLLSGYVRKRLLSKWIFHLWDCPEDLWMQSNEDKLGLLWRDLSSSPLGRTLKVILEAALNYKPENGLGQEATKSLLEPIRKRRGYDTWNNETENMAWTRYETRIYNTKGDGSKSLI